MMYDNTGVTVELGDIVASGVELFDFDYPVPQNPIEYNGKTCSVDFDRQRLEQKIIDHYRFRQIGQETVGRFKHYLKTKMLEIMPYYVQLYEFDAKFRNIDDPLESYNLVETFTQNTSGSGKVTGTNSSENAGTSIFSDTPEGSISNLERHMSSATKTTETVTGSSGQDTTSSGETSHTLTRKGNIGVQPLGGEVENIRNAFINIDMQIVEELADLFLKVY